MQFSVQLFAQMYKGLYISHMKLVQKTNRLTQVKQGRKVIFEILQTRNGKFTGFEYRGLGLISDCETVDECVAQCITKKQHLIEDFKKRLV